MRSDGSLAAVTLPTTVSASTTAYNADNEQTKFGSASSISYDSDGQVKSDGANTYTWDARNHLSAISGGATTASFVYDAFGRRMGKSLNGVATEFLYDGLNPVQELNGNNPPSPTANLLTGLDIDEYFTRTDSNGAMSFLTDALGSTLALTDSGGSINTSYIYEPFGKTTVSGSNGNPYQFTGRENDGTGLYFYRARYYSPTFQRFIEQDPISFASGDPNLYGYVYDNPVNLIDPPGLWGVGGLGSGTGEIGVGAAGAGGTVATGFGLFFKGLSLPSLGAFFTAGGFAGGPGWGDASPSCPSNQNGILGAYIGGGGAAFITNADSISDLAGPFTTYSANVGWGLRAGSVQISVGQNAAGQTIWVASYGGPFPFPSGGGFGASLSEYNTNTWTTGGGAGGQCSCH